MVKKVAPHKSYDAMLNMLSCVGPLEMNRTILNQSQTVKLLGTSYWEQTNQFAFSWMDHGCVTFEISVDALAILCIMAKRECLI